MKIHKILAPIFIFVMVASLFIPLSVYAQGSTTISISNRNPSVGENFTVTVNASAAGQMTISYDSRVLTMVGSTVQGDTTSNSLTINASSVTMTFRADNPGSSGVVVSSPTLSGSSINVPIQGQAEQAPTQSETPPAQETPAPQETEAPQQEAAPTENETPAVETGDEAPAADMPPGDITVDGVNYLVSERFPDSGIPAGFVENSVHINDKDFRQLTNGLLTILYLKRSDNPEGEGSYFIYDEATGTASPLNLLGSVNEYVIIRTPDSLFSDALEKVILSVYDISYEAYRIRDAQSEFFYVFGMNEDLADGWYAYDSLTGKISRADTASLSMIGTVSDEEEIAETEGSKDSFFPWDVLPISKGMFIGIVVLIAIIIVVIIINIALKRRERDDDYDDEDDEYFNDEDDEYVYEEEEEDNRTQVLTNNNDVYRDEESESSERKPIDKNLIFETEQFTFSVKELGLDEEEGFEDEYETGPEDRAREEELSGEELIDDIIKKKTNGSHKQVDLLDLDDL